MDRFLKTSRRGLDLVWIIISFLLLAYVIYGLYKGWKKKNQKKKARKQLTQIMTEKVEEETTMLRYPKYSLEGQAPHFQKDPKNKGKMDLGKRLVTYSYADLLEIVEKRDHEFYNQYMESVLESLKYKRKRYQKILAKKISERDGGPDTDPFGTTRSAGAGVGTTKHDSCEIFQRLLEEIERKSKRISTDLLEDNFTKMLFHPDDGLESLIEREEIKSLVTENMFAFKKNPEGYFEDHKNGLFLGGTGLGKSRGADTLAQAFGLLMIIIREKPVTVTKNRVVSPYVDDTAGVTSSFIESHTDCIIVFEEIYSAIPKSGPFGEEVRNHGQEFIDMLVYYTGEKLYIGLLWIFGVGYKKDIEERFLKPNAGMDRRFPLRINLRDYSSIGLTQLMIRFLSRGKVNIGRDSEAIYLKGLIEAAQKNYPGIFEKQAGAMQNIAAEMTRFINNNRDGGWSKSSSYNKSLLLDGMNIYLDGAGYPPLKLKREPDTMVAGGTCGEDVETTTDEELETIETTG